MGTVDTMITGLKKVKEIAEKMKNAELLGQIAELMLEAAELKGRIADLENDNRTLRKRQDLRDTVEWRDVAYYAKDGFTEYGPGPFCPICFNVDGLLIPLRRGRVRLEGDWVCNYCVQRASLHKRKS